MSKRSSGRDEMDQALSSFIEQLKDELKLEIEKKSKIYEFEFFKEKPSHPHNRFEWEN